MTGPLVEIRKISHSFGRQKALEEVSLNIEPGSYTVLLGPSGSGKTTLLSILGGFVHPGEGSVFIRGNDFTRMPPARRPTAASGSAWRWPVRWSWSPPCFCSTSRSARWT